MTPRTNDAIRLTAPIALQAGGDAARLPSKFTGIAYSGGLAPSYGVVIDLASTNVVPVMPLLSEHDRAGIIGTVVGAQKTNGQILVSGKLFSDIAGSKAEQIAQLSQRGFPFQMSVGLFGFSEDSLHAGQSAVINGRRVSGPVTVLRNGTVRECSICAIGADPDTEARFFNSPHAREHQIAALFREIGQPLTAEQTATFKAMSPETFAMFVATIKQLAGKAHDVRSGLERLAGEVWGRRRLLGAGSVSDHRTPVGLNLNEIYARRARLS